MLPESPEDASISTNEVFPSHTPASVLCPWETHGFSALCHGILLSLLLEPSCMSHILASLKEHKFLEGRESILPYVVSSQS